MSSETSTQGSALKLATRPKLGHDPISGTIPTKLIRPSPENDKLYRPVDPRDPEIRALAESIREHGLLEPLVITQDFFILSGHRRFAAARLAGLGKLPVRMESFSRGDDPDYFLVRLREHNRQREKSFDEKLREEVITADPEEAYEALIEHREKRSRIEVETIEIRGERRRARISGAKAEFVAAIKRIVLIDRRRYWPLSDRVIHYALLNDPPLRHASKPDSRYDNTHQSYKSLVELLTRLRLVGEIPMDAIDDETRPVIEWNVHDDIRSFISGEIDGFLKGYFRNLMRSQPNHIEILVEKNTVAPIVKPIASKFCIPMTSGRGYASLPPRMKIDRRYTRSGKDRLVLLIASDFDPDGEDIAETFSRSMRDDFGIEKIDAIKVSLTQDQARRFNLPLGLKAKGEDANGDRQGRYKRFVDKYGEDVWELEAIRPEQLLQLFRDTIDSVIDIDAFNAELDAEKADAAHLENVRRTVNRALRSMNLDADSTGDPDGFTDADAN